MSREKKRLHYKMDWTPEDRARHQAIRAKFQVERPTLEQLTASGEYTEPILLGAYWELAAIVECLRGKRERQRLSLGDAAKRSGIDKATLSRLESGQNVNPTWNTLTRYAAALCKELALTLRDVPASGTAARKDTNGTAADGVARPAKKPRRGQKKTPPHG
ncbi:MAG TPA: helix-turn-helix transcriptional regulator [Gemmataceae bacterium]